MFREYLLRWKLTPDGSPTITATSGLLLVRAGEVAGMLRVALVEEEKAAGSLLSWWGGDGAARVLAHDEHALLMERARSGCSLVELARNGRDDEASRILCAVAARLHVPRPVPPPELTPLEKWFAPLRAAAGAHGGVLTVAAGMAADLLATPRDVVLLHGDIHHGNVLDFGERGWLAIDPKGLVGERSFDYANLFCNPDLEMATREGRLLRRLDIVANETGLHDRRLLAWIVAWAGLSAAFLIEDGLAPEGVLDVAAQAAAELHA